MARKPKENTGTALMVSSSEADRKMVQTVAKVSAAPAVLWGISWAWAGLGTGLFTALMMGALGTAAGFATWFLGLGFAASSAKTAVTGVVEGTNSEGRPRSRGLKNGARAAFAGAAAATAYGLIFSWFFLIVGVAGGCILRYTRLNQPFNPDIPQIDEE